MKKIYITAILLVGIVIVVNLLSSEFHFRLDLTEDHQYTLSLATKELLTNLEEPVTVKAYFTANMPPSIAKARTDFQELLVEYAARSKGMIQYEFIDPAESPQVENDAMKGGIQPIMINVREKDQTKQQKAFLGAVVTLGEKQEVLPYLPPNYPIEYGLSSAIKKLSVDVKPSVGFVQGHGEPSLADMQQLMAQLDVLYTPVAVSLNDSSNIPSDIKTLVLIRPIDSLSGPHLKKLDDFLSAGGRLVVALNSVTGNLQASQGFKTPTGVEAWLATRGVTINPDFVVDAKCASVTLQQQTPFGVMQSQVPFPYLPIVSRFNDHPVTQGLEAVVFQFASPITYSNPDTTLRFTPLAFSSARAGLQPAPVFFDIQKQWTEADLPLSDIVMAAALEGKISGGSETKMMIVADGDFIVNGSGQQAQRLTPDNVNLVSNAIDWLTDDTGLIELRTKGTIARPIEEMEDGTRAIIKYTNFLLPLLMVLFYGLYRFQRNRIRRLKRMAENYEEA